MKYINKKYKEFFDEPNLINFQSLIENNNLPWFEEPNVGRNGLSGVKKVTFENKNLKLPAFIKIQKNYFINNKIYKFLPFIRKTLVAKREFSNIMNLKNYNIPICEVLYFEEQENKAIFITKELSGYNDLRGVLYNLQNNLEFNYNFLKKIARSLAIETAKLHKVKFSHNCLYPKHIFINSECKIKFIDFEKCKKNIFGTNYILRDLECLFFHISEILNSNTTPCIDINNNFTLRKLFYLFIDIYLDSFLNINQKYNIKNYKLKLLKIIYKRSLKKRKKYLTK